MSIRTKEENSFVRLSLQRPNNVHKKALQYLFKPYKFLKDNVN